MKNIDNTHKIIVHILLLIIAFFLGLTFNINKKVILPDNTINIDDRLVGYYDSDSVLHLKLDNNIRFEWEGLEKDIPKDGSHILIEGTDENIIYLNNIDE